jgi:hypothetical protein
MRWEDYRQSENLEDRRGGGGGEFAGLPGGRGGIGHRHHGRARPARLGARYRPAPFDRRRRADRRHRRAQRAHRRAAQIGRATAGRDGPLRLGRAGAERGHLGQGAAAAGQPALCAAEAGAVQRRRSLGLRHGAGSDGPVLLPQRPAGLSRPSPSSRRCSASSAAAATSPMPMSSATRSATTSRTCSASCRR